MASHATLDSRGGNPPKTIRSFRCSASSCSYLRRLSTRDDAAVEGAFSPRIAGSLFCGGCRGGIGLRLSDGALDVGHAAASPLSFFADAALSSSFARMEGNVGSDALVVMNVGFAATVACNRSDGRPYLESGRLKLVEIVAKIDEAKGSCYDGGRINSVWLRVLCGRWFGVGGVGRYRTYLHIYVL